MFYFLNDRDDVSHKGTKDTKEFTAVRLFVNFVPLCEAYNVRKGIGHAVLGF